MTENRRSPRVIGLTGGIGSGKSVVLQALCGLGAEGIDADQVAHEVILNNRAAYAPVLERFGQRVLGPDGEIDRKALGGAVFGDAGALRDLEGIVHPAVAEEVRRRVSGTAAPLVVIEAIKLFEAGLSRALCEQVWVTRANPEQQVERLRLSRGMDAVEVQRRMLAQMPAEEMAAKADRVIDTSGTLAWTKLQALAGWTDLGLPLPTPEVRRVTVSDAEGTSTVINSVVREGGLTVVDRTYTIEQERAFIEGLPPRGLMAVAILGGIIAGFQVIEPYANYTGAMDHVGAVGTFVARGARGRGVGTALARANFKAAQAAGYTKLVINVRSDNPGALAYYHGLGFRPCGRLERQAFIEGHYVDELLFEMFLEE